MMSICQKMINGMWLVGMPINGCMGVVLRVVMNFTIISGLGNHLGHQ